MITKSPLTYSPKDLIVIKNSPFGIKLEAKFEDLYEKIVGINTLKVFSLLERFQNAA